MQIIGISPFGHVRGVYEWVCFLTPLRSFTLLVHSCFGVFPELRGYFEMYLHKTACPCHVQVNLPG